MVQLTIKASAMTRRHREKLANLVGSFMQPHAIAHAIRTYNNSITGNCLKQIVAGAIQYMSRTLPTWTGDQHPNK